MKVARVFIKAGLLPVAIVLLIIELLGSFAAGVLRIALGVISSVLILTALIAILFQCLAGKDIMQLLVAAFICFVVPFALSGMAGIVARLRRWILYL